MRFAFVRVCVLCELCIMVWHAISLRNSFTQSTNTDNNVFGRNCETNKWLFTQFTDSNTVTHSHTHTATFAHQWENRKRNLSTEFISIQTVFCCMRIHRAMYEWMCVSCHLSSLCSFCSFSLRSFDHAVVKRSFAFLLLLLSPPFINFHCMSYYATQRLCYMPTCRTVVNEDCCSFICFCFVNVFLDSAIISWSREIVLPMERAIGVWARKEMHPPILIDRWA